MLSQMAEMFYLYLHSVMNKRQMYITESFARGSIVRESSNSRDTDILCSDRIVSGLIYKCPARSSELRMVLRLVHTSNVNAHASASTSKHMCELPQRKRKRQRKKWKTFHFHALTFAPTFAFHTCGPGQHEGIHKHKMKKNSFRVSTV